MGLEKRLKSGLISVRESLLDGVTSPASSEPIYTWLLRSNYFFKLDVSPKHKSNFKKTMHTLTRAQTHAGIFFSLHPLKKYHLPNGSNAWWVNAQYVCSLNY